jgi:OPT family oligopeptide transporter
MCTEKSDLYSPHSVSFILWGKTNDELTAAGNEDTIGIDDIQRDEAFNREHIPNWLAYTGYALLSIIAIIVLPIMFRQVKWYYVIIAYVLAPVLGFSNAYGTGLTDMNMSYNYSKIALFIFAAWGGKDNGVIAGLVGCEIVKQLVQVSADLMHDFKTGHLTLTSPRSMFVGQVVGTAMGCIISPLTFMLFYKAFDIGNPDGYWKAPYALIFRNMAILGVEGVSALPKHCIELSAGFFTFAVLINITKDMMPCRYRKYVPLPMAMAVPFLVVANFAIDMCGKPDSLRLEQDEQQGGSDAGACGCFRFYLRRWYMDGPFFLAFSCKGESTGLHEVHAWKLVE